MAFKMYGKTPMTKALVGKQKNLPANLRAAIEAAPETPMDMYGKSPMDKYASDAQRKAIHASKAEKKSSMKKKGCGCKSGACMCK